MKEALLAALDDCTEKVRYQAALAIAEAACNHCETCNRNCCCDEEMTKRLSEIAYEKNDECCWLEPSERVREAAKQAMFNCCSMQRDRGGWPAEEGETPPIGETPGETPSGETPSTTPEGESPPADPPPPPPSPEARYEVPDLIFSSAARRPAQAAPSKVMADKVRSYRQRQPRLEAASVRDSVRHQARPATPDHVAALETRPLEIADAIAVLQQLPGDASASSDYSQEAEVADDADIDEPTAVQAVAASPGRPRYALVTAVAEPQRTAAAPQRQPATQPTKPVKRFPWQ